MLLLVVSAVAIRAAENPTAAFRREWEGRRVIVQRTLLTLVYDERSRVSTTTRGKREGLVVATRPGAIRLTRLQAEGRAPVQVRAFLNGHRVVAGDRFTPLRLNDEA